MTVSAAESSRRYREKNPEKVRAATARYNRENKEKRDAYRAARKLAAPLAAAAATQRYRERHPEKVSAYSLKYRAENREKLLAYAKAYNAANPPVMTPELKKKASESSLRYLKKHPEKSNEKCARRYAAKVRSIPPWADHELIELVYAEASHRGLEVDHIVPLKGENVCGLHVHYNMQLLSRSANASKGNRFPIGE